MATTVDDRTLQTNTQFMDAVEFWLTKAENNRFLWNQTLHLNHRYFDSLQQHAVPHEKPQFVSWAAVKGQFGPEFGRMDCF